MHHELPPGVNFDSNHRCATSLGQVLTAYFNFRSLVLLVLTLNREASMLPPDGNRNVKIGLAGYQEPRETERDYLGYSLVIATLGVGVVLALVFRLF